MTDSLKKKIKRILALVAILAVLVDTTDSVLSFTKHQYMDGAVFAAVSAYFVMIAILNWKQSK